MTTKDNIRWFKENFRTSINAAVQGTPFDIDMITTIAVQETGYLWGRMRNVPGLSVKKIVALCCGDTLDSDAGRKAFPKTKAALIAEPDGEEMFKIARQALVDVAAHISDFKFALQPNKQNKFCHGFGVFQRDLQFFLDDPDYFLDRKYEDFDTSLAHCVTELKRGLGKVGLQGKSAITDFQFATVAIAYNRGSYNKSKGLKQGYKDENGKFYGEHIADYLALARTVPTPGGAAVAAEPAPGEAIVVPAGGPSAKGPRFVVDTLESTLRLRSAPVISKPPTANVIGEMPDGHPVRSFTGAVTKGFIEIEAELGGSLFRGFASQKYLKPVKAAAAASATANAAPVSGLPEAHMPTGAGTVIKRTALASAHSLNEANMPRRTASEPEGLRGELAEIIDYLASDKPSHKRYQPGNGKTFCNIYAHDYCMLAGVYLPRCWWTQSAIAKLAAGQKVQPKYEATIEEVRANGLYRWLRDFGTQFGWIRATSTNELQDHANLGGVSIIVARNKNDGSSGHIVAVVPETAEKKARRDTAGTVIAPLQSQAGATNFRYGTSKVDWWKGPTFAEFSFWIHA